MNWKFLILLIFAIVAGYTIYMGVQFYLSGTPFTLQTFATYTIDGTQLLIGKATVFIQEKWSLVMTTVGAGITAILGIYKVIQNKISGIRQTAETQVESAQTQATQQYVDMQNTITTQKTTIASLQNQALQQSDLTQQITTLSSTLEAKQAELDRLRAEFNLIERLKFPTVIEKVIVK